jgi:serine phosphatase RsbU (regulator of sigma subunit)
VRAASVTTASRPQPDLGGGAALRIAAALGRALTAEQVATAIFEHVSAALGAGSVALWLLDAARGVLRLSGAAGNIANFTEQLGVVPLDAPIPAAEAVVRLEPVLYRSREERDRRWPTLRGIPSAMESNVSLPLIARDTCIGVVACGFTDVHDFTDDDLVGFSAVAEQCALALDRALLFDAEHRARDTLEFLGEATQLMISSLEPNEILRRLVRLAVPRFADACAVSVERDGALHRVAIEVRDHPEVARLVGVDPIPVDSDHPSARTYRKGRMELIAVPPDARVEAVASEEVARIVRAMQPSTIALVPIVARGRPVGTISFAFVDADRAHTDELEYALTGIAARVAMALENATRFEAERQATLAISRALLPGRLPEIAGYDVAAAFKPASGPVCGDWYDVDTLPDGSVLLGVGDVSGHGIAAAATMSALRNAARALSIAEPDPRRVLDDLGRFIVTTDPERFATVAYARLQPSTGRTRWSSAGHPPPLLLGAAGGYRFLTEPRRPPLGTTVGGGYDGAVLDLEPGDTLLLYTDGVVERRRSSLYEGLERLAALALDHRDVSASALVDVVIETLGAAAEDDCCVLVARRLTPV